LYCALAELNSVEKKLITVEDPVEYRLPGINQVQVNDKIELSFARVLRSALRQDPDIVLVGEMRDQETAQIGLRAAMTGHLVLSTLHTNDAASTPLRLMDMGVPRYMVGGSLQAVLAQRLVRVICESCTTPYEPTPTEREWLRGTRRQGRQGPLFPRQAAARTATAWAIRGRTGVYELLEMTRAVVDAANDPDPAHFLKVAHAEMARRNAAPHAVQPGGAGPHDGGEAMRISNQIED
jgi:MSHA biogenesis protein MshE